MGGDFTRREARLAFVWAKMRVKDELTNRFKHTHMNFTDFLEALSRASEMMTLPDDCDIEEAGCANIVEYFNSMDSEQLQEMLETAGTHYTDHYGKVRLPLAAHSNLSNPAYPATPVVPDLHSHTHTARLALYICPGPASG